MDDTLLKPVFHPQGATDVVAATLSSLCLVHCLLLPLLLLALPALAVTLHVGLLATGGFHWLLIAVAVPVSALALWKGFVRHHNRQPAVLALLGFALMALGAMAHGQPLAESGLTIAGGALVALAHWRNWQWWPQLSVGCAVPAGAADRDSEREIADEGVGLALMAKGGNRAMAWNESGVIAQRPELAGDRIDQLLEIPFREVRAAD